MARLALFVSLGLAISSLPSGLAGPACARKNHKVADCVEKCKTRWGWTGSMMGTDPWGSVMKNVDTTKSWDNVVSQACGSSVALSTSTSTSTASTTVSVSPTAVVTPSTQRLITTTVSSTTVSSSTTSSSTTSTSAPVATLGLLASFTRSVTTTPPPAPTTRAQDIPQAAPATSNVPKPNPPATTAPAPAPAPPPPSNPPASSGSGGTSGADIQAYLQGHNTIRAAHGASALTWSDDLASKAQQWANGCLFQHSGGSLGAFGENLAAGTGASYGIATAIKSWTDEVTDYNPSNPTPSHFTQVVWKGTSQVGCAVQSCSGIFDASFGLAKYYVCEYSAQGNIIGRFAQNVQV